MAKKRRRRRSSGRKTIRRKYVWLIPVLIGLFLFGAASMGHHFFHKTNTRVRKDRITVSSGNYQGIDVSKYQGTINWEEVAQDRNIQFVYIKATEGATATDRRYSRNIKKAREAGLKVGSYHFFTYRKSAREQFENFKRQVRRSQQDLIPVVDVEQTGNNGCTREQVQHTLSEFMELVKREYGCYPILYSQYSFYNAYLAPEFNKYFIFIARYGMSEPVLRGKGKYGIWQYSEKGRVKGIKGYVDLDRFASGYSLNDILL